MGYGGRPVLYTPELISAELDGMLQRLLDPDDNIVFIGQLFLDKPYSRQRFSEWCKRFSDADSPEYHPEISDALVKIREAVETKIAAGMLTGGIQAIPAIFTLKARHGWEDSQTIKHQHQGNVQFSWGPALPPAQQQGVVDGGSSAPLIEHDSEDN